MAQIAVAPFVLKDVVFTVDIDSYEKHVSTVRFVPDASVVTWKGLTPSATFSESTSPTWTCEVSYAQDWETADSFSQYLMANAGQEKDVVSRPKGTGSNLPEFTATLIIAAGPIGGDVDTVANGSVTMGVVGEPALAAQA